MSIPARIQAFLDEQAVPYECIEHKTDHTALQTAWDTNTPPREFAKTVFLEADGQCVLAVLPASEHVSIETLRTQLGAHGVKLMPESDIARICPDCEVGAAPPFGSLYALPVYVSPRLRQEESVTFNAGTHREAIRMRYDDFERLARPRVVPIALEDPAV